MIDLELVYGENNYSDMYRDALKLYLEFVDNINNYELYNLVNKTFDELFMNEFAMFEELNNDVLRGLYRDNFKDTNMLIERLIDSKTQYYYVDSVNMISESINTVKVK